MVLDERRQLRILYRDSLARMIDLEVLSTRGDVRDLFVRFAAILGALSFVAALLIVPRYGITSHSVSKLNILASSDEEFLISTTIAVTGLFAVLAWNVVFPDRRDCLILGLLPVRARTTAVAKLAAIITGLATAVASTNIFTGLTFPLVLSNGFAGGLRSLAAWWVTAFAAGAFVFCFSLALQGVAAQLLSWRAFLRISGLLQLGTLFVVLSLFFMTPPFTPSTARNSDLVGILPSFWFTGLLHVLKGDRNPIFGPLAGLALRNLLVVTVVSAIVFALSFYRNMRRIVEAPDIEAGSGHAFAAILGNTLAKTLATRPLDRAILLFTARTIARSRQHRLLLAAYSGIGFAMALAFSKSLLDGTSRQRWNEPNVPLLIAGALVLVCAIAGTRAIFVLPYALPANWIFRITAVHSPAAYFGAVRKTLIALAAVPTWIISIVAYFVIWPGRSALEHSIVLILSGFVLVDRSLYQFRKIPFACSWLPAPAQSKMQAAVYGGMFILFASMLAGIERWTMLRLARFIILVAILGSLTVWARRRRAEFAASPGNSVQFDDLPPTEILVIDLRLDGEWLGDQAYVDAIDPNFGRSFGARLKPFAIGAVLLLAMGFIYEQASEWRDRDRFPQIGRSVDIGGRALNIYCAGEGSPTVVMDSGANQPGYSWLLVEPGVAKFTRACWYDRAGYGWSDPAPGPRTSAEIVNDLHKLLRAAGVAPPYVLVGHSFGGFNVRVFAGEYPGEVVGMVLVDSADEYEDVAHLPRSIQSPVGRFVPTSLQRPLTRMVQFLVHAGLARLLDEGVGRPTGKVSAGDTAILHALRLQAKSFDMSSEEGSVRRETIASVRAVRNLGNIPLIVLTAGKRFDPPSDEEEARKLETYVYTRINRDQPRLAALSMRGRQIILANSGHGIPFEAPEAVVNAVREVVAKIMLD